MTFHLSGTLLRFVDFKKEIAINASTIQAALDALVEQYPKVKTILYAADGHVRQSHRLFLNSESISDADLKRTLHDNDSLDILTAIAGG